jgi:tetratricopeptide (TPR) repeat protein
MMRRAVRMAGGGQQRVREAQALMAQSRFEDAAKLFSQLSDEAAQRGMIRPAGYLAMQAARAFAQAGKGDEALAQAKRALDIMLNAGTRSAMQAARAMPRAITFLRGQGFAAQANALEQEATKRLAKVGLTLQAMPMGAGRSLPATCPQCAGSLRSDDAEWIDATSAECPWCGSTVKAV